MYTLLLVLAVAVVVFTLIRTMAERPSPVRVPVRIHRSRNTRRMR